MVELNHCREVNIGTTTGKYGRIEIDNVLELYYDAEEFSRLRDACNVAIANIKASMRPVEIEAPLPPNPAYEGPMGVFTELTQEPDDDIPF